MEGSLENVSKSVKPGEMPKLESKSRNCLCCCSIHPSSPDCGPWWDPAVYWLAPPPGDVILLAEEGPYVVAAAWGGGRLDTRHLGEGAHKMPASDIWTFNIWVL